MDSSVKAINNYPPYNSEHSAFVFAARHTREDKNRDIYRVGEKILVSTPKNPSNPYGDHDFVLMQCIAHLINDNVRFRDLDNREHDVFLFRELNHERMRWMSYCDPHREWVRMPPSPRIRDLYRRYYDADLLVKSIFQSAHHHAYLEKDLLTAASIINDLKQLCTQVNELNFILCVHRQNPSKFNKIDLSLENTEELVGILSAIPYATVSHEIYCTIEQSPSTRLGK